LLLQVVEVKYVVPKLMVLLGIMSLEVKTSFLQGLTIDSADEAFASFVLQHFVSLPTQAGEVINEHTSNNIAKEHIHEDNVDHIIAEPSSLELLHVVADFLLDVELNDAAENGLAVMFRMVVWIDGLNVVVEGKY
jgi:hypothetical protein